MKRLGFLATLCVLVFPAHATEIVRQSVSVRLVPGALEASAWVDVAEAEDRPVFCLADSADVEEPFDVALEHHCEPGLRAWTTRKDEPAKHFVLKWRMPIELTSEPLVLRGKDGWYPRGSEVASAVRVSTSSAIEGVTLVSNAHWDTFRAAELENACLLVGRWKRVRLEARGGALEFYSTSEGFDAPAFAAVALLEKANEHFGYLAGGRHLFVEVPESLRFDTQGLSAWPSELLVQKEGRLLRIAEALLGDWWGARVRTAEGSRDWTAGARLYAATHRLLDRGGAITRTEWIDAHALLAHGEETPRRRALRAAMAFHALRRVAGESSFDTALRTLARRRFAGNDSWADVRSVFAQATRGRSDWVFDALVDDAAIPRLLLDEVAPDDRPGRSGVRLGIASPGLDRLDVEVKVTGEDGDTQRTLAVLDEGRADVIVRTRSRPLFVEVDPDAHLLRALEEDELPPMLGLVGELAPDLVLLGTGRGEAFLSAARRFARTRQSGRVLLDREATQEDLSHAQRVWIVGRPGGELRELLASHLPLASERLAWIEEEEIGPAEARIEGGDTWLLAGLGRWPGGGARIVLLDAPQASGLVTAAREARAEGPATWRVRTSEGKLIEGRGPRGAQPLVRRLETKEQP